jgi:AcrR family transcriptional regulator
MARADEGSRPGYSEGRDALLDAAVRVVAEHGLRGLTYRRVAEEAGTTHGLVSYHFGSRAALLQEAAAKADRRSLPGTGLDRSPGRAEDFARELPVLAEQEADAHAFQFELALEGRRRPELADVVRGQYEGYFAGARTALDALGLEADDAEADAAARLLFAALDGLMLQQLVFGEPERTAEALDVLRRVLGRLQS